MEADGGRLAIELTRTRGWQARDRGDDDLEDWAGLVRWACRMGLLEAVAARPVARRALERPAATRRAVHRLRRLREIAYRMLVARSGGLAPERGDLARLNEVLRALAAWREVRVRDGAYVREWTDRAADQPDYFLWQCALSLESLLTGESASRIRLCSSHDCGWLFLDESRNGSRRWCSMEGCGNVEKARRFRRRERDSE
jgi:predicted RNA-binding Zn ribbon-like protein